MTPSPESMTVPVSVRSDTCREVHEAARARIACTAMYNPAVYRQDTGSKQAEYSGRHQDIDIEKQIEIEGYIERGRTEVESQREWSLNYTSKAGLRMHA